MKIGLPGGLLYHSYGSFMEAFLKELPVEMEVSSKTDREILDRGIAASPEEACLPVKIFAGHVELLRETCDLIAVPRIMSCEYGESFCPKLNGLPELIGGRDLIFTERIDLKSEKQLLRSLRHPCRKLGIKRKDIRKAFEAGKEAWKNRTGGLCQTEYIRKIFLAGHSYNINDSFANMDLVARLNRRGVGVITEEAADRMYKEECLEGLIKKPFWHNFTSLYGAALFLQRQKMIDGIICLSSFSCGTDSFTMEMIRSAAEVPVLQLKIDEMTAPAGYDTRIEAFCDVISAGEEGCS